MALLIDLRARDATARSVARPGRLATAQLYLSTTARFMACLVPSLCSSSTHHSLPLCSVLVLANHFCILSNRLFGAKCAKCAMCFSKTDLVMRARNKIYHVDCFRCVICTRQLTRGDEFALRDDDLFCKVGMVSSCLPFFTPFFAQPVSIALPTG